MMRDQVTLIIKLVKIDGLIIHIYFMVLVIQVRAIHIGIRACTTILSLLVRSTTPLLILH